MLLPCFLFSLSDKVSTTCLLAALAYCSTFHTVCGFPSHLLVLCFQSMLFVLKVEVFEVVVLLSGSCSCFILLTLKVVCLVLECRFVSLCVSLSVKHGYCLEETLKLWWHPIFPAVQRNSLLHDSREDTKQK